MDNKILVTRSSMPSVEEYIDEIRSIWESHWLTNMGPEHKSLQAELKQYMGVQNVELLTNGHMALELSLQAMNLQGEVITTPFTFASTTHAIVRNGLEPVGANAKMNEFCAAMGMCNLRHIDEEIEKRKKVVERYRDRLENTEGLQLNVVQSEVESNYAYFPVVFNEKIFGSSRNEVFDALDNNGIGARKYFYPLTNTFGCFHKKYNVDETPVARYVAKRVLTLPLYADLAIEDVDRICDIILSCRQ